MKILVLQKNKELKYIYIYSHILSNLRRLNLLLIVNE